MKTNFISFLKCLKWINLILNLKLIHSGRLTKLIQFELSIRIGMLFKISYSNNLAIQLIISMINARSDQKQNRTPSAQHRHPKSSPASSKGDLNQSRRPA